MSAIKQVIVIRGCPRCKLSKGEKKIERLLNEHRIRFQPQYTFPDLISPDGGVRRQRLRFDFAVLTPDGQVEYLIEFDGLHHFEPVKHTGGERRLRTTQRNDKLKTEYCVSKGLLLIRIPYTQYNTLTIKDLVP